MNETAAQAEMAGWVVPSGPAYPAEAEGLDLRHHIGILRRRWPAILVVVLVVVSVAALRAFRATPIYEGRARLRIETRLPQLTPFDPVYDVREQGYLGTQTQLIRSRAVLEKALEDDRLAALFPGGDPDPIPTGLWDTVRHRTRLLIDGQPARQISPWEQLRGAVAVEQVRDTNLVDVCVQSSEPTVCALIANAVARAFVARTIERRQEDASETLVTLRTVRREQEDVLNKAEDALLEFRQQTPVPQLGGVDRGSFTLERLQALQAEYTSVQMQRIGLSAAVQAIDAAVGELRDAHALMKVKVLREDPVVSGLFEQIVQLDQRRQVALETYGEKHPEISALEVQRKGVMDRFDEAISYAAESVRLEHQTLVEREKELAEALAQQQELVVEVERQSHKYDRLRREVERQGRVFDAIVDRMSEVDLTDEFEVTNVSIEQEAVPPRMPTSPNRKRTLLLGLLLGLMLGVGFAYGLEYLDDTVKAPHDVEQRLGAPWLGYVPRIKARATDTAGLAERSRYALEHPENHIAEAFRSIRTSIHFSAPKGGLRSLAVTSTVPQEGKTVVAANLAGSFARAGRKVLLVDADMRRAMVHEALGLRRKPGLSDMIVNALPLEKAVQKFVPEGRKGPGRLHVLTVGSHVPNPSELLGSGWAGAVMETLRKEYEIVIYDGPPAAFLADTAPLANRCDGVLVVMRAARCRRNVAARTLKLLMDAGAHVTGVVLNDVPPRILRAYGHDGYYYHQQAYEWQYAAPEEAEADETVAPGNPV